MQTKVKICGITQLEDARYCAGAGADYLGFIQYRESPRYVEPAMVRKIVDWVYGPQAVGVFVNDTADEINRITALAGFAVAQLHGTEAPEVCTAVAAPVIKTIHVDDFTTAAQLSDVFEQYASSVDYLLLDTRSAVAWGGTGVPFDWSILGGLDLPKPLFLSGGLNADNVERARTLVRPYAVDLSSGVESAPGKKDFDKLTRFFDAFRRAEMDSNER